MSEVAGYPIVETRWQCQCGRFVAESAITTEDYADPDAYYGIGTRWSYACAGCGVVDTAPRLVSWDAGWMEADDER